MGMKSTRATSPSPVSNTVSSTMEYDDSVQFTLSFRSEITASLRHDATAEDIKDALEALEGVDSVVVEFGDLTTVACASPVDGNEVPQSSTWSITFYAPSGDLPQVCVCCVSACCVCDMMCVRVRVCCAGVM